MKGRLSPTRLAFLEIARVVKKEIPGEFSISCFVILSSDSLVNWVVTSPIFVTTASEASIYDTEQINLLSRAAQ